MTPVIVRGPFVRAAVAMGNRCAVVIKKEEVVIITFKSRKIVCSIQTRDASAQFRAEKLFPSFEMSSRSAPPPSPVRLHQLAAAVVSPRSDRTFFPDTSRASGPEHFAYVRLSIHRQFENQPVLRRPKSHKATVCSRVHSADTAAHAGRHRSNA